MATAAGELMDIILDMEDRDTIIMVTIMAMVVMEVMVTIMVMVVAMVVMVVGIINQKIGGTIL